MNESNVFNVEVAFTAFIGKLVCYFLNREKHQSSDLEYALTLLDALFNNSTGVSAKLK
jgi:hypothetical protein